MLELKNTIENKIGFKTFKTYANDINNVKNLIQKSFSKTLSKNKINDCIIDNYHKLNIKNTLHKKIWTRKNRIASTELINYLKNESHIFKILKKEFGELEFSQKVDAKKPDSYWRLVRPNQKDDVGSIHADEWFWIANNWRVPSKNKKLLKIWILLSNNLNKGLSVIPNSHKKKDWIYKKVYQDGIFKPKFNEKKNIYKIKPLTTPKGKILVFNYGLLHSGLINKSNETRISLEFTLYYKG
jgi:hypothetical protein|tara:strand:+ start:234 stop:956 length:723 start_codon:yes stop_codon:yes gene_type:complete